MAGPSAAFFDLDKTIIATSSSAAFSRPFMREGLVTRSDAVRAAYAHFLFSVGGADERQTSRLRDALSELVKGWDVAKVTDIVSETVQELIDPVVYLEALALIRRHQENGRDVVIVSASGAELVAPIAQLLGAEHWVASRMEIADGVYTGEITFYAYGENKAAAIRELAAERGYDLATSYAYSDSITDAPMLNAVGHGFVVNPDRGLRRAAVRNGWGVLYFRKPVALRKADARGPAIATVAFVALGIVIGALVMRAARRRRLES
ncbi:HAD-IB family hydrolase [Demequina sp. TTPB684]|uniref:HAD family hydrolase n=1 Tax=unclassified Demequina TaxID=2620311 RepID=UPI001CF3DEE1|nr:MULTISPECIES: HAD family hydrolase [unclassified Demequina]MCB2412833.1 HAD-IB family hydrolase [Demequina sp. TTPB684]UPU87536.1 HAD-IB family hydrolase [Demequina sp. TMPB413]